MKINILLPYKEKFDVNKASSVSITIRNNLLHTKFLSDIRVYGQNVEKPLFKDNFQGIKYSIFSFKSKNVFLAHEMLKFISKDSFNKQLIEIHNRPYLIEKIAKNSNFPVTLFLHNDPQTMKGSKSVKDRHNILENCAAVFCVSEYVKAQFIEGLTCNIDKIFVLYNGVRRTLKKFPLKKKEILFVGRIVPEKGVDIYVDAIISLVSGFPDWNFGLIGSSKLGGDINNSKYAKCIINKFKKIGDQAIFYGFKDYSFVQEKMRDASIIVIPSLWEEPFGLVAAEAMSNGIAIIASNVGGIPEIIKDNGILIENINSNKVQASLTTLMDSRYKRELFQQKAWKNFKLSSHNSSKNLDKYRNFIFNSTNQ
jgi:glycosyltransferase involved in cell wall biosynthesis